jgi:selenophosphate synthetase-related protein
VGRVDDRHRLTLMQESERAVLWDLHQEPLTGFGPRTG